MITMTIAFVLSINPSSPSPSLPPPPSLSLCCYMYPHRMLVKVNASSTMVVPKPLATSKWMNSVSTCTGVFHMCMCPRNRNMGMRCLYTHACKNMWTLSNGESNTDRAHNYMYMYIIYTLSHYSLYAAYTCACMYIHTCVLQALRPPTHGM